MAHKNIMEPPWNVLGYPQTSLGWRMGGGEDYKRQWSKWFTHLSQEEKQMYMAQHPEPEDWFEFYHPEPLRNTEETLAGFKRAGKFLRTYLEKHYELAELHEEAGHYGHAVTHLGKVLFCLMAYTIWDDEKISETVTSYKALKRRLVQQMVLSPVIKGSWNALRQSEQRVRVEITRGNLTPEKYKRLQTEVYLPSELGRTWTKCFEHDMLYIHRHWDESCLFLVMFEAVEHMYHIAEAWMNLDPAISLPLTRPEREPDELLAWLLKRLISQE